ncbi:hypothetical protein EDB86DRAFT_2831142 [Lactarius hatsudake]|nr:hypothetical protein EDB86DRAFT_2831142 [Lactarius hatsudake]
MGPSICPRHTTASVSKSRLSLGDHGGAIGHILDITGSVATVDLGHSVMDGAPSLQVPLCALAPYYTEGDHIKFWWSEPHTLGIITTLIDAWSPTALHPASITSSQEHGLTLTYQGDLSNPRQRGYIEEVDSTHASVIDERSLGELRVDLHSLDVCAMQGLSCPRNEPSHPLLGQEVAISRGPYKGYRGHIRDIRGLDVLIRFEACVAGLSLNPVQSFTLYDIRTPPWEAELSNHAQHVLLTKLVGKVQQVTNLWPIPLYLLPEGDGLLGTHKGRKTRSVARTVPPSQCGTAALEGEIMVSMVIHSRSKQLSVHPNHLVPWEPVVGGDVIVTTGPFTGTLGVAKEKGDEHWVVKVTAGGHLQDQFFKEEDLAYLDPI